jgi:PAS domain S-box-containing protein
MNKAPLHDPQGNVSGVLDGRCDIADRTRLEQELKNSEERLRVLFDLAPDGCYMCDLRGRFVDANRAAEEITGYRKEELLGKSLLDPSMGLLPARQVPKAAALLATNALEKPAGPDEFVLNRKDGTQVTVEVRTFPMRIDGQRLVMGIARDVSERTRDLEEANIQLWYRIGQLNALHAVARETTRKMSLSQLAETAFRAIIPTLSPDLLLFFLWEGDRLALRGLHTRDQKIASQEAVMQRCGQCLCAPAATEVRPIYASDVRRDPQCTLPECRIAGIRSYAALPLVREDRLLGVLAMASTEKCDDFSEQHDFLEALASEVAVGAHNAILHEALERHLGRLQEQILERRRAQESLGESEQRFRAAFETAIDCMFVKDRSLRYTHVNQAMERLFGRPASELVGRKDEELFEAEAARHMQEVDNRVLDGQILEEEDTKLVHGVAKTFHVAEVPLRDDAGEIAGLCGVVRDISEKKQAEEALRRENAFRAAIITRAAEGLCVSHEIPEAPFVRFTVWNDRMTEITGYTMDEINRQGWYQTMYPDPQIRDRAIQRMDAMRDGDDLVSEERLIARADGEKRTLLISTSTVDIREEQTHVLAVMLDITERKQAVEQLGQLQAALARVGRVQTAGEIASGIAHELNQPLSAIATWADLGLRKLKRRRSESTEDLHKTLKRIASEAERAGDIIRRMRQFVKNAEPCKTTLRLPELVEEIRLLLASGLRHSEVNLAVHIDKELPVVLGDPVQLQQVLVNLIRNAVEAMEAVEPGSRQLTVAGKQYGDLVEVAVSDTGNGISADRADDLFLPFYTTKPSGMGMGLAICRSIVEAHGGQIRATANPDGGTTFVFVLPIETGTENHGT